MVTVAWGCASAPQQVVQGLSTVELVATPFLPDNTTLCGPTSLATLISAHGQPADLELLTRQVYVPGKSGAYQAEMIAALRSHGLVPVVLHLQQSAPNLQAERLHQLLKDGQPILVLQKLSRLWLSSYHYAVVVGYDAEVQRFILRSGDNPRLKLSPRTLITSMQRAGNWALVALSSEQPLPPAINQQEALQAAAALEDTGLVSHATWLYAAGARRWSENPMFSFGLANLEIQAQNWPAAIERLQTLQAQYPANIPILNNLIAAFIEVGDRAAAERWLRYGFNLAELSPESEAVLCRLQRSYGFNTHACPG